MVRSARSSPAAAARRRAANRPLLGRIHAIIPPVALIKHVTNGKDASVFKAISLTHALSIIFAMCSVIGAQQTWMWAAAHERSMIVQQVKADIASSLAMHDDRDTSVFRDMERRMESIEQRLDADERQLNIITGRLMKP